MLPYRLLADAVLLLHAGVVAFVIGGLLLVVAGNALRWRWVNNGWFRLAHVAAIGVVVVQAWLGKVCPLTTLESWLRAKAGFAPYRQSFIEHRFVRLQHRHAHRLLRRLDRSPECRAGEQDRVRAAALAIACERDKAVDDRRRDTAGRREVGR